MSLKRDKEDSREESRHEEKARAAREDEHRNRVFLNSVG
jgi:hypothetical protein